MFLGSPLILAAHWQIPATVDDAFRCLPEEAYEKGLNEGSRLVYDSPPSSSCDVLSEPPIVQSVHAESWHMGDHEGAMSLHKSRYLVDSIDLRDRYCGGLTTRRLNYVLSVRV
ncbi:hypothetical protein L484_003598 [Morus notabilis]|uniref:Uncharacterized protein n=1 Tax=Morus notabilis TaxID=981085 RepID=W9R542_9ROSA|nr:hypothetical protein L484_003598 [Morus notabilis]